MLNPQLQRFVFVVYAKCLEMYHEHEFESCVNRSELRYVSEMIHRHAFKTKDI